MWKAISHAFSHIGPKKPYPRSHQVYQESSDDETCSNASTDEGLECPICWESFNIVENVPHVLWCGHTLCKNCVLGLRWASLKFSTQQIQIPFFICCPWCHLLTFRLVYQGNLRFPSKNFFLLWMVESRNGDRTKSPPGIRRNNQSVWSPSCTSVIGNNSGSTSHHQSHLGCLGSSTDYQNRAHSSLPLERPHLSLQKSLDFFIRFTSKIPLVIVLLLFVICVLPSSVAIIVLYLVITILFALPSFLVLYFAYPALDWLVREITT